MNTTELKAKLISMNVPSDLYSLTGGLPNEAFCFEKQEKNWIVYYSERGMRSDLKSFDSESEACDYFLDTVTSTLKEMGII